MLKPIIVVAAVGVLAAGTEPLHETRPVGIRLADVDFAAARGYLDRRGEVRISGVVTTVAGAPLSRALVQVTSPLLGQYFARSDNAGRYEMSGIRLGRYDVSATKVGYVRTAYTTRNTTTTDDGTIVLDPDGGRSRIIDFSLVRGGVVEGRIVNEFAEPIVNAVVTAARKGTSVEHRHDPHATTDDLGKFRLFDLSPGTYDLTASVDPSLADLQETGGRVGYIQTNWRSEATNSAPGPILVQPGRTSVANFVLRPVKLSRIAGTMFDFNGLAARAGFVRAARVEVDGTPRFGLRGSVVKTDEHGTFVIDLPSDDDYLLVGSTGTPWLRPGVQQPVDLGRVRLHLGKDDVDHLQVRTQPGGTIVGEIVFEGTTPDSDARHGIRVVPIPTDVKDNDVVPSASAPIREDNSFELKNVFGRNSISAAASGWYVKTVLLNQTDITREGVDVHSGQTVRTVRITLTRRSSE